jgi:hypothetical protein
MDVGGKARCPLIILLAHVKQVWRIQPCTYIPTGATFSWKYPGSGSVDVIIDWKHAADVLPTGDRFDPQEIEKMARRLMRAHY